MKISFIDVIYLSLLILTISQSIIMVIYVEKFKRIDARLYSLENSKLTKVDSLIPTFYPDVKQFTSKFLKRDTVETKDQILYDIKKINRSMDSIVKEMQLSIKIDKRKN